MREIIMAVAAAGFSLFANAATTNVSTVAELITAVSGASAGDEIVVMASGSPYEFASTDGDEYGHLYAGVSITLRGSTGDPDDVVLVGNANRILYLADAGNAVSNLTFRSGSCSSGRGGAMCSGKSNDDATVIQNCVFDSCSSTGDTGACGTSAAKDAYFGKYIDCIFTGNTAGGNGGAISMAYSIQGCTFRNNCATGSSSNGGAVQWAKEIMDSTFIGNSLSATGGTGNGGGAIYMRANKKFDTATISGCTFAENSVNWQYGGAIRSAATGISVSVTNCVFAGNSTTTGYGGAVYDVSSVVSCVFSNNCVRSSNGGCGGALASVDLVSGCTIVSNAVFTTTKNGHGGGAFECTLTGCYIASNYAYLCGAAADCRLYFCTNEANSAGNQYYELGIRNAGCYAEDCIFRKTGTKRKKTFGSSGFNRCRFLDLGRGSVFADLVALTNCLVTGTNHGGTSTDDQDALFSTLTGASSMINCTIVSNDYKQFAYSCTEGNLMDIKNCFFYGNKIGDAMIDIDGSTSSFVASIKNCILSVADTVYIPDYATSDTLNIYGTTFNPGFVGAADPENPFALSRRSPAVAKAGLVEDWMAAATDIRGEGFPRLRDGKVNIGCYQCWEFISGLRIIFR